MTIQHVLYEEVEDYNAYDFYLMKRSCTCEKEFKTIGVERGPNTKDLTKQFKQVIALNPNTIHPKQVVTLYSTE